MEIFVLQLKGNDHMKLTIQAAVGLALLGATTAAFATSVTPPSAGPTPDPGTGAGGIVVEVWDAATGHSLAEWLGPDTTSFGGPAEAAAGRTLDYGVLGTSAFASTFSASEIAAGNVQFTITGASAPSGSSPLVDISMNGTPPNITNGGVATIASAIVTGVEAELNGTAGCNSANPCIALGGSADPHWTVPNLGTGIGQVSNNIFGTVGGSGAGSASDSLLFYQLTKNGTSGLAKANLTQFANASGVATWTLSSSGDLVYSVPGAVSAVPLPAAFWLLGSGLLGLAGVSRRKILAA